MPQEGPQIQMDAADDQEYHTGTARNDNDEDDQAPVRPAISYRPNKATVIGFAVVAGEMR